MRFRHLALGCTLTGAMGCLGLPPAAAQAAATPTPTTRPAALHKLRAAPKPAATPAPTPTAKPKPTLTISAPAQNNVYGATVKFTVTLGQTVSDRQVTLYASPYGEKTRTKVAVSNVSPQGQWHPTYLITKKTTFTVIFDGDAYNAPNNTHITLEAFAKVTNRLTGTTQQATIDGISYLVFHTNDTLDLYSTVVPAKHGQCLEPESQQFDPGVGWEADTKYGCDALNATGHDIAPFTLKLAVGERYRIRANYVRNSKDLANLSTSAPWLYFEVVK